jgi:hypothetical protein
MRHFIYLVTKSWNILVSSFFTWIDLKDLKSCFSCSGKASVFFTAPLYRRKKLAARHARNCRSSGVAKYQVGMNKVPPICLLCFPYFVAKLIENYRKRTGDQCLGACCSGFCCCSILQGRHYFWIVARAATECRRARFQLCYEVLGHGCIVLSLS